MMDVFVHGLLIQRKYQIRLVSMVLNRLRANTGGKKGYALHELGIDRHCK